MVPEPQLTIPEPWLWPGRIPESRLVSEQGKEPSSASGLVSEQDAEPSGLVSEVVSGAAEVEVLELGTAAQAMAAAAAGKCLVTGINTGN